MMSLFGFGKKKEKKFLPALVSVDTLHPKLRSQNKKTIAAKVRRRDFAVSKYWVPAVHLAIHCWKIQKKQ